MDIANSAQDGDSTLEKDGLKVFLEKRANELLSNATIDFSYNQGFTITGIPQSSCCG